MNLNEGETTVCEDGDTWPLKCITVELTPKQVAVCWKAVEHFGRRAQLLKVAEELRELAVECERAAAGGFSDIKDLKDVENALALERADVEIVLYQFDHMLLPSLRPVVREKIASQIERLERRLEDEREHC